MIFDSHIHIAEIEQFAELVRKKQLGVLANAASISEYEELLKIEGAHISFGIHPWNTGEFCASASLDDQQRQIAEKLRGLIPYFEKANTIGEIGMDSVWCQWDLKSQRELFIAQLEMAEELRKPVVLHTKGQEGEIAEILKAYTIKKLVHWYSCEEHLEEYLKQDCYFTVGPDFNLNRSVKAVIEQVPVDRLLVETDGVSAVEWAIAQQITPEEIPKILREAVKAIAEAKQMTLEQVEVILEENFHRFIGDFQIK